MATTWTGGKVTRVPVVKTTDSNGNPVAKGNIPTAEQSTWNSWYQAVKQENRKNLWGDNQTGTYVDQVIALPNNLPGLKKTDKTSGSGNTGKTGGSGGSYSNPYAAEAKSLYNQLVNRGPFQYDLQGNMLYRQYADQYNQLGKQAMMDAMGTAAGLTSGYGNSWAQQVGSQQYQQYLTQLNSMIPDFYDRAYQEWLNEGDLLLQKYELAKSRAGSSGGSSAKSKAAEETADANAADLLSLLLRSSGAGDTAATDPATMAGINAWLDYNLYGLYSK